MEKDTKSSNWGGYRQGAGLKVQGDEKPARLNFRASDADYKIIEEKANALNRSKNDYLTLAGVKYQFALDTNKPSFPDKKNKKSRFTYRCSDKNYQIIQDKAAELGLKANDFLILAGTNYQSEDEDILITEDTKKARIEVKPSTDQYLIIKEKADLLGMTVNEYLIQQAMKD